MQIKLVEIGQRVRTLGSSKIHRLPVLILMPHSRCNCRCVMCDIWKSNQTKRELKWEDLEPHLATLEKLNLQQVVLSGGEALMHPNLFRFCAGLKRFDIKITLLSTGLLLKKHAREVVEHCDEVIVSIDGSPPVHDRIRDVPRAFAKLSEGVAALRAEQAEFRVTGRCVLQRLNFRDLGGIVAAAKDLGLDQISFLGADVSASAFSRAAPLELGESSTVALTAAEAGEFEGVVEAAVERFADDFDSGFIAESPDKLRRIPRYYAALNGGGSFPPVRCNAPWVSAVVEANGDVLPCFFHPKIGSIRDGDIGDVLNGDQATAFRRGLDVATNPVCRRCVCSLELSPFESVV